MGKVLKGWRRKTGLAMLVIFIVDFAAWKYAVWYHATRYPFGLSHCCDKALYFELLNYADRHDGAFPSGEASPEASLSLLFRDGNADANLLRGKSVPETTVEGILGRGELLGPESCGWHYVEGLRKDHDGRIAIFWDKAGLSHSGGRLAGGGHIVWFLNSEHPHITADEWPKFLAEQEELLKRRARTTADPANE